MLVTSRKVSVGVSEEKTKDNMCLFLVARIEEHNCTIKLPISPSKVQSNLKHLELT